MKIEIRSPSTGSPVGIVNESNPEQVAAAVASARVAQREWAARPIKERAAVMRRFRELVVAEADGLAEAIAGEQGKTKFEALALEVQVVVGLTGYFAKHAERILAREPLALHLPFIYRKSYLLYVPRGVIGIISPWNFPFSIPIGQAVMALLAGNGVVIKPSEHTPLIAERAVALLHRAGVPEALVQVVHGGGSVGQALIDAPVDYLIFTGSVATGRKIYRACADKLIPVALELGGKAPAIVCADAELERTARALVWGAFANSGQVCASVERAYVHTSVYEPLAARVVELTKQLRQGDPLRYDTDVGAMTWQGQVDIVEKRVGQAVAAGAKVATGGQLPSGAGRFYPPTVLLGCRQDMDVMREEIFGPVLPMMKVASDDEAVALANDSHLGLLAYVFTSDRTKGKALAERVAAGTVMVNDVLSSFGMPETPWHGIKQSGIGRSHSDRGLRDLCLERHINVDRVRPLGRELWWYPYTETFYRQFRGAMRWMYGRWRGEESEKK